MPSVQDVLAAKIRDKLLAQPDWARDFATVPTNVASGIMSLPALPADLTGLYATLAKSPRAQAISDTLNPDWVQGSRMAADELKQKGMDYANVKPAISQAKDGSLDVDIGKLIRQEGPGALMPIGDMSEAAEGANLATKVAYKAKNALAEVALPGVQDPNYLRGAAVQGAITVGAPIAADAVIENNNKTKSLFDDEPTVRDAPPVGDVADPLSPPTTTAVKGIRSNQSLFDDAQPSLFDDHITKSTIGDIIDYVSDNKVPILAGLGAAALASNAATREKVTSMFVGKAAPNPKIFDLPASETGAVAQIKNTLDQVGTSAKAGFLDEYAPVEAALQKTVPDQTDGIMSRLRSAATPLSLAARTKEAMKTGKMPNSFLRLPSLDVHMSALAQLKPEQLTNYTDILFARSKLQDLESEGKNLWEIAPGTENEAALKQRFGDDGISTDQLKEMAATQGNDPVVSNLVENELKRQRGLLDYMFESDLISNQKYQELKQRKSDYIPLRKDQAQSGLFHDVFDAVDPGINQSSPSSMTSFMKKREGFVGAGELQSPIASAQDQFINVVRAAEVNKVRKEILETLNQGGAKYVKQVDNAGKDTISVFDQGAKTHYRVTDDTLHQALQFSPHMTWKVFSALKRGSEMAITGKANPVFAPKSYLYDVGASNVLAPKGTNVGMLDRIGQATIGVRPSEFGIPDPSTLLSAPIQGVKKFMAEKAYGTFKDYEMSLLLNPNLKEVLGDEKLASAATMARKAYEASVESMVNQTGAASSTFNSIDSTASRLLANADIGGDLLNKISTDRLTQLRTSKFARYYKTAMETMLSSRRHDFFENNLTPAMRDVIKNATPEFESNPHVIALKQNDPAAYAQLAAERNARMEPVTKLAAQTTRLVGDPSETGSATMSRVLSSSMRWYDVGLQAGAQLLRSLGSNGKTTLARIAVPSVAMAGYMANQFANNPAALQHFKNNRTVDQNSAYLPIYDDHGNVAHDLPIPFEWRPMYAPLIQTLVGIGAFDSDPVTVDSFHKFFNDDIASSKPGEAEAAALKTMNPITTPMGLTTAASAAGIQIPDQLIGDKFGVSSIPDADKQADVLDDRSNFRTMSNTAERLFNEIAGTTGQAIVDMSNTAGGILARGGKAMDAMKYGTEDFKDDYKSQLAWTGLFNTPERESRWDSTAKVLKDKADIMQNLSNVYTNNDVNPTGGGRNNTGYQLQGEQFENIRNSALGDVVETIVPMMESNQRYYSPIFAQLKQARDDLRRGDKVSMRAFNQVMDVSIPGGGGTMKNFDGSATDRMKAIAMINRQYKVLQERQYRQIEGFEDIVSKKLQTYYGINEPFHVEDLDGSMRGQLKQIPRVNPALPSQINQ